LLKNNTYLIPVLPNADSYLWTLPPGTTGNGSLTNTIQVIYGTSFTTGSLIVKGHNGCGDGNSSSLELSVVNCGDYWTQKDDFGGTAIYAAVGFSIGAKGYIGTGEDAGYNYKKDFWEFDPSLNSWTQKADFGGTAISYAVGFSIGAKGYIGTGMDAGYNYKKDFWEFDPTLNSWMQKADFGGTARYCAVGFSIGSKGYVGTGLDVNGTKKDFWEFDPLLNTWTQKADFGGTTTSYAVGFSIGAKGYIGTGLDINSFFKNDFWEFDPLLNTWTQKADFGGLATAMAVGFSIGPKGYIGTGYDAGYIQKKDFWEFDPTLNTWIQKADFGGTATSYAVGFSIGNKGYIGTGIDYSAFKKNFWEYTPDGFNVGLLSGDKFCSGSLVKVPFTLSAASNPGNVFTAQLSDSLGNFNNPLDIGSIVGIYSDTIPGTLPSLSTDGHKYRIRVQSSDPVGTSVDNLYNISIYSATIPGIVSGGSTILLGIPTDTLRLSGNTGAILTWQKQLDGSGYNDISTTSGLTWYIETPTVPGTWNYRTIVKNGACNTELSTPATVVVHTGPVLKSWIGGIDEYWEVAGNWSPAGVPGAQDDVIIPVFASVMPIVKVQGYSCNNILIQSGATLTVNPGIVLTVNGHITIEGQ
jgi:hypothetical protein